MMITPQLPIRRNLSLAYMLSLVIALLMAGASLAGLLFQSNLYPTQELRRPFVSNDVVNLFIGLPILLGSLGLARSGKLLGLLFWPGALFYVLYNYSAYAVAMPLTVQFVSYLLLVILSAFTTLRLVTSMDREAIRHKLSGAVPEKFAGGVLAGLGGLFFLRTIGQVMSALNGQLAGPEVAVLAADLLIMPFWVIGGILLWQKQALGYAAGAGLLFQANMLFIGLLIFFVLQPFLTATPFPLTDFMVIFVMGMVCFIPFGLYVRGILRR